jgi:hypothetical protein
MVIVSHPAFELFVQRFGGRLADPDDRRANLGKPTHEIALRRWKRRLDEHNVHAPACYLSPDRSP